MSTAFWKASLTEKAEPPTYSIGYDDKNHCLVVAKDSGVVAQLTAQQTKNVLKQMLENL